MAVFLPADRVGRVPFFFELAESVTHLFSWPLFLAAGGGMATIADDLREAEDFALKVEHDKRARVILPLTRKPRR